MLDWGDCDSRYGPLIAERHAGALAPADAAALESHLQSCDRCRSWDEEMVDLVSGMRAAERAGVLDHPAPEALAALSSGSAELAAEEKASLEQHLAECGDCRAEWNVATRWTPAAPVVRVPSAPRVRWGWFAAGAVSTAAAALGLVAVLPRDAPIGIGARPVLEAAAAPVQVRGAHHRAGGDATAIPIAPGDAVVIVALTVEASPGARLEVELRNEVDEVVSVTHLTLDDAAGLLILSVAASHLPARDGAFHVRVEETGGTFRYPFRIDRSGG